VDLEHLRRVRGLPQQLADQAVLLQEADAGGLQHAAVRDQRVVERHLVLLVEEAQVVAQDAGLLAGDQTLDLDQAAGPDLGDLHEVALGEAVGHLPVLELLGGDDGLVPDLHLARLDVVREHPADGHVGVDLLEVDARPGDAGHRVVLPLLGARAGRAGHQALDDGPDLDPGVLGLGLLLAQHRGHLAARLDGGALVGADQVAVVDEALLPVGVRGQAALVLSRDLDHLAPPLGLGLGLGRLLLHAGLSRFPQASQL
jgi:hypothetical protein